MKQSILVFIISILFSTLSFCQEETIVIESKGLFGKDLKFDARDSMLVDSIKKLISINEQLVTTINSLHKSNYSQNAKRYSYRLYTEFLNNNAEETKEFLLFHGIQQGLYIPMHHYNEVIPLKYLKQPIYSDFLRKQLARAYLEEKILSDCHILDFNGIPYYFEYTKVETPELDKESFYISIGNILVEEIKLIKELMGKGDECFDQNIELILEHSTAFKKAYYSN